MAQEASTWKNQRGTQSEASFPERAGIRYFHDSFPISKESQIRALEKAFTNKAVLNSNLIKIYQETGQIDLIVFKISNASFFLEITSLLFKR